MAGDETLWLDLLDSNKVGEGFSNRGGEAEELVGDDLRLSTEVVKFDALAAATAAAAAKFVALLELTTWPLDRPPGGVSAFWAWKE